MLGPGRRIPDTLAVRHANGAACLLHELAHRSGHTALLLGGKVSKADQLAQLESEIQSGSGAFVETTFTLMAETDEPHPHCRLSAAAAEQLGLSKITLLIIRPDGHVGLRADDDHLNAFAAYQTLLASGHV